jgi:hypothetical protein
MLCGFKYTPQKKQHGYDAQIRKQALDCILGWKIVGERNAEAIQQMVDEAPTAKEYFSDGWETYVTL